MIGPYAKLAVVAVVLQPFAPGSANGQPHPRQYVEVYEVRDNDNLNTKRTLGRLMDRRNNVEIRINHVKLRQALKNSKQTNKVKIRITAELQRAGRTSLQPVPVDGYVTIDRSYGTAASGANDKAPRYVFKYEDQNGLLNSFNKVLVKIPPDAFIDITRLEVGNGDRLYLKITDTLSRNTLNYITDIATFGFDTQIIDSFLLLHRSGIKDGETGETGETGEERKEGNLQKINFRPAPGTTFSWVYRGRSRWLRILTPGIGYNVSFTDWGDTVFDGTNVDQGSLVEIATGGIVSLFDNALHLTWGWNLNVESKRRYFGIGFSASNLGERFGNLFSN